MAAPQNFRSAFNGFNREDVVNYISFMTNRHETELNQLRSELAGLNTELESLREKNGSVEALEQENADAKEELARLQQELEASRSEAEELRTRLEEIETAPAEKQEPAAPDWTEELNAYRRAESTERRARERVGQMYDRATGAIAEATTRLEGSSDDLVRISDRVQKDLEAFREAICAGGQILAETADALSAIRPEET